MSERAPNVSMLEVIVCDELISCQQARCLCSMGVKQLKVLESFTAQTAFKTAIVPPLAEIRPFSFSRSDAAGIPPNVTRAIQDFINAEYVNAWREFAPTVLKSCHETLQIVAGDPFPYFAVGDRYTIKSFTVSCSTLRFSGLYVKFQELNHASYILNFLRVPSIAVRYQVRLNPIIIIFLS